MPGKVDDAVMGQGAAVIDPDHHRFVVPQVRDPDERPQREGPMGAGHGVHVEILAAGGLLALKELPVPGGAASLVPVVLRLGRLVWLGRPGGLFAAPGLNAGGADQGHKNRAGDQSIASGASILRNCDSVHIPPVKILWRQESASQTKNQIYFSKTIASTGQFVIQAPANLDQLSALTIAGFDPSSGAGITADLKVFAAHGVYGLAAITALTVQSTRGVRRVEPVAPEVLLETLSCLAEDLPIAGVKIGMLGSPAAVRVVADFLGKSGIPTGKVVLDPVLRSSFGRELLSQEGTARLKSDLLPRVGWITPNLEELSVLAGVRVSGWKAVPEAAERLAAKCPGLNIVVTGGHLERPDDFLRAADGSAEWFSGQRVETMSTHGTGCAFSSALLARLLAGDAPAEAVAAAKEYVAGAMRAARPMGHGRGPMHHLYRLGQDSSGSSS